MGYIVVGVEAVGGMDTLVEKPGHRLVILAVRQLLKAGKVIGGDGRTQLEVYAPLILHDARKDAIHVLTGFLHIAGKLRLVEFQGFQHVARLPFVTDSNGHDVQIGQGLDFVLRLTHAEHLDDALVSDVDAVLRTTVSLCYPNRLSLLLDAPADILREVKRGTVELAKVATRPLYAEHLV